MSVLALSSALALLASDPAPAEGPIATTPASAPAPQSGTGAPSLPTEAAAPAQAQPVAMGPCGPEKVKPDGTLDTAPHGEVEVGVGTNGYRHVAGRICKPIGQNGVIAVEVSDTQGGGRHRR